MQSPKIKLQTQVSLSLLLKPLTSVLISVLISLVTLFTWCSFLKLQHSNVISSHEYHRFSYPHDRRWFWVFYDERNGWNSLSTKGLNESTWTVLESHTFVWHKTLNLAFAQSWQLIFRKNNIGKEIAEMKVKSEKNWTSNLWLNAFWMWRFSKPEISDSCWVIQNFPMKMEKISLFVVSLLKFCLLLIFPWRSLNELPLRAFLRQYIVQEVSVKEFYFMSLGGGGGGERMVWCV